MNQNRNPDTREKTLKTQTPQNSQGLKHWGHLNTAKSVCQISES